MNTFTPKHFIGNLSRGHWLGGVPKNLKAFASGLAKLDGNLMNEWTDWIDRVS